jgi:hypothetical protein
MDLRMGKRVREVIHVGRDEAGRVKAISVYRKQKRKKKSTWGLNQLATVVRTIADSQRTQADAYLRRHDSSARKKKDGWIRDFPYNVYRAARRGAKKLRAISPLPLPGDD